MPAPIKVVLIEDDPAIRNMYDTKLTQEGFAVETAGDGDTGLDVVQMWKPDVVLVDVMMPHMSGVDFVVAIRSHVENDHMKIIVLTNLDDVNLKKSLEIARIDDYLVKAETTPAQLAEKIRAHMK